MAFSVDDVKSSDLKFDGWRQEEQDVTLDGAAGSGAVGTVSLFTVTGSVIAKVYAICSTNVAGAGATLEVGVTGSTAAIIAQTTGTDIDANEIWHDATPDAGIEASSVATENVIANGLDIFMTVGTANATGGVLKFICLWKPLSKNGDITPA